MKAILALEDGLVLEGETFAGEGGERCLNGKISRKFL